MSTSPLHESRADLTDESATIKSSSPHPVQLSLDQLSSVTGELMSDVTEISPSPLIATQAALPPQLKAPSQDPDEHTLIGAEIEGYLVEGKLGKGGFGTVYAGRDLGLDRPVAIKVFTRDSDQAAAQRFRDEGRLLAKLHHRNIIQVYRVGELDAGHQFLVMERFGDGSLRDHWPPGARPPYEESALIASQILRALEAAHQVGVIHRDIKEANILYHRQRQHIKLCDFGIARSLERLQDQAQTTRAGVVIGTRHYIAPERYQGVSQDPRSDLYSVGVILFRLLTGRRPLERYAGEALTPEIMLYRMFSEPLRGLEEVPQEIARVCSKLLSVPLESRYQSASEAAQDLERALEPQMIRREDHRRRSLTDITGGPLSSREPQKGPSLPLGLSPPPLDLAQSTGSHHSLTMTLDQTPSAGVVQGSRSSRSRIKTSLLFILCGASLIVLYWFSTDQASLRSTPDTKRSAPVDQPYPMSVEPREGAGGQVEVKKATLTDTKRERPSNANLLSRPHVNPLDGGETTTSSPPRGSASNARSDESSIRRAQRALTPTRSRRSLPRVKRSKPSSRRARDRRSSPFVYPAQSR